MHIKTLMTSSSLVLALLAPAAVMASVGWDDWVSEENGGPWSLCSYSSQAVSGFDCNGSYCDDVRVQCQTMPALVVAFDYNFSDWYSEESSGIGSVSSEGWYRYDDDNSHVCNYSGQSGILTGIHCHGSYCDDIQLECATPKRFADGWWQPVGMVDCSWTGWYSEEQPPLTFATGANRFITGVRCGGAHCDNKRYYVCSLDVPADSCGGECGGSAPSGCWCDAACQSYGDCCDDYTNVCLP
ncbi:MAG: hypothetical protein H6712_29660 [Myxococcales bacterium]|nr:hypothetical protein [Myxococcales bacterium]